MARVLIVDRAGRAAPLRAELEARGFAVREVEGDPLLPGHVFDALENVAVVCWLMGRGDALSPEANGEQLETVLLKVVDTGVRGFVFERPDESANQHVEHARSTWHIPIGEVVAGEGESWVEAVCDAAGATLGLAR